MAPGALQTTGACARPRGGRHRESASRIGTRLEGSKGVASLSFWDARDHHLARLFSIDYQRLDGEDSARRLIETDVLEPYPKPIHVAGDAFEPGNERETAACLGDEVLYQCEGGSYGRIEGTKERSRPRADRRSLLPAD